LRTVVISGGLSGPAEANLAGGYALLRKPFAPARLVDMVNNLLAARRAEAFRSQLLVRQTAPFSHAPAYRQWGLNE
jgi:hypothetical protein